MKNSKMIPLLVFTLASLIVFPFASYAQTNSASNSADPIQENIKQRIQKTVEENTARIKGLTTGSNRRAIWGSIKRISEESMSLETARGTQIIALSQNVPLFQNAKAITIKDVEIDNEAIIYGTQDGEDFAATKVDVLKTSILPTEKTISVGNIQSITKTTITILPRGKDEKEIYEFQKKSEYQQLNGEEITLADLEEGLDVIIISSPDTATKSIKDSLGGIVVLRTLAEIEK